MAEQVHRQISLSCADKHSWHEAPAIESADVGVVGVLVPSPAGYVGDHLLRHDRMGSTLELGERDRQTLAHTGQSA